MNHKIQFFSLFQMQKEKEDIMKLYYIDPELFTEAYIFYYPNSPKALEFGRLAYENGLGECFESIFNRGFECYDDMLDYSFIVPLISIWMMKFEIILEKRNKGDPDIQKLRRLMKISNESNIRKNIKRSLGVLDKMKPTLTLDIERQEYEKVYSYLIREFYFDITGII